MAFWVLVNYGIAQQQDLNRLSMQPLVKQLQTAMSGEQGVAGMDAAQKQRMAETLYWMGSLQLGIYVDAVKTGNTQELNARMHDAKAALRQMGLEGSIRNGSKGLGDWLSGLSPWLARRQGGGWRRACGRRGRARRPGTAGPWGCRAGREGLRPIGRHGPQRRRGRPAPTRAIGI